MVCILDADKEGFLRSDTSLIQTIGRSARHVNAEVILYADKVTSSMQRAIDETGRRRILQLKYNAEHGITPETIKKAIRRGIEEEIQARSIARRAVGRDEAQITPRSTSSALEAEMLEAAEKLEFERAAALRDKILELRSADGGRPTPAGSVPSGPECTRPRQGPWRPAETIVATLPAESVELISVSPGEPPVAPLSFFFFGSSGKSAACNPRPEGAATRQPRATPGEEQGDLHVFNFRLVPSRKRSRGPTMGRLLAGLAGAALAVSAAIASIGCDSSTFLPPPPDGLRGAAGEDLSSNASEAVPAGLEYARVGARSVEIILDRREAAEAEGLKAAARTQAGIEKIKLRTTVLGDQDLPAQQVELVREAVARNALVLIVEPADPSDSRMAEVLQRAREEGIPVVLLNRPLSAPTSATAATKAAEKTAKVSEASPPAVSPGTNSILPSVGAKPMVLVTSPPFTASAHQIVASAIRNAKNAKLDPKGGAIIVINTIADPFLHRRTEAVRDALKESGITTIEEIAFSKSTEVGTKLLTEKLKSNPKPVLVFSMDSVSTSASRQVINDLIPARPFVLSAYAADSSYGEMTIVGDYAAVAIFSPARLIRKAIATAVDLAHGREVASRIEVPIEIHDSPEDSSTAQSPNYFRNKGAPKKGS